MDKQRSTQHYTKNEQHETHLKPGVTLCASEGQAVPVPLVTPVVLI
jgi:hypothetical protein